LSARRRDSERDHGRVIVREGGRSSNGWQTLLRDHSISDYWTPRVRGA
jgi:hypothetical protein